MPKLQIAQMEIKCCPLKKLYGTESCVILCCLCVIHAQIIPPHLSMGRQKASEMRQVASAPPKSVRT